MAFGSVRRLLSLRGSALLSRPGLAEPGDEGLRAARPRPPAAPTHLSKSHPPPHAPHSASACKSHAGRSFASRGMCSDSSGSGGSTPDGGTAAKQALGGFAPRDRNMLMLFTLSLIHI